MATRQIGKGDVVEMVGIHGPRMTVEDVNVPVCGSVELPEVAGVVWFDKSNQLRRGVLETALLRIA